MLMFGLYMDVFLNHAYIEWFNGILLTTTFEWCPFIEYRSHAVYVYIASHMSINPTNNNPVFMWNIGVVSHHCVCWCHDTSCHQQPNTNPAYEFRGLSTKNPCMNTSLNFILSIGEHSLNLVLKQTNKQLKWPMRSRLGLRVLIIIHCRPNCPPVLVALLVALTKLHRITSSRCGQITHHNEGRISQAASIYHCCICMCVSVNHFF